MAVNERSVFVVHGRNEDARVAMFGLLRAMGLQPIEWSQAVAETGAASPYIGQVLDAAFDRAQAVVILMTPDEVAYLRDDLAAGDDDPQCRPAHQARPNVLFEAGMAMGRDPERTVIVELGSVRPFSDIAGRHTLRVNDNPNWRHELAQRLDTAGCAVDTSGTDWMSAGELLSSSIRAKGLPLAKKLRSEPAESRRHVDLRYQSRNGGGRLEIINVGVDSIFDVSLVIPDEAGNFGVLGEELPIEELPAGKSIRLITVRAMGGGKNHFMVPVTYIDSAGETHTDPIFLSLAS